MISAGLISGISVVLVLLAIALICMVPLKWKNHIAAGSVLLNFIIYSFLAVQVLIYGTLEFTLPMGSFLGHVPLKIDALSAWFILIINITSLSGFFYGTAYLKKYNNSRQKMSLHWISFILFHVSMLWVCMFHHGFAFLVSWEIMSLSSMILVIFEHEKQQNIRAGLNYFVQMHLSVIFLSIAFVWLFFQTGSFNFEAFRNFYGISSGNYLFILFFIGFGFKAGFIPFHSWLPHAHPAAPSHVSGVMSGVIVKLGIYGIIRMSSLLTFNYILMGEIVLCISLLTGLYGILNASVSRDFKKMLAYCTIENIGIIGIGMGTGLIGMGTHAPLMMFFGFGGALLHTFNHSLFKSMLFFSAGSVYRQTHTRDMDKLGGLAKLMPKTAILFLIGSVAICALPPFNGFVSEFILYKGLIEGMQHGSIARNILLISGFAGLSLIGGISIFTFTKNFGIIFLGSERSKLDHKPEEVSNRMLVPQFINVALMLSVAFVPAFYIQILNKVMLVFNQETILIPAISESVQSIQTLNLYFAVFILVILTFWFVRQLSIKQVPQRIDDTWGCGYLAPTSKIQYTGKSFTKPLAKILNFLLIEQKHYKEFKKGAIFPKKRSYSSVYNDFFEHRIIDPLVQRFVFTANYFKFIQNGRTQSYVIYGISFILLVFIFTFFYFIK